MFRAMMFAFLLCTAGAAILGHSDKADAKWIRAHLFNCRVDVEEGTLDTSNGTLGNCSQSTEMVVRCSVDDTDYLAKADVTHLNLHGYDGTPYSNVCAKTCITYYDSNGGACASESCSSSYNNHFTLSPARTYWTGANTAHFGYLQINVGAATAGYSCNTVRGYYLDNV